MRLIGRKGSWCRAAGSNLLTGKALYQIRLSVTRYRRAGALVGRASHMFVTLIFNRWTFDGW